MLFTKLLIVIFVCNTPSTASKNQNITKVEQDGMLVLNISSISNIYSSGDTVYIDFKLVNRNSKGIFAHYRFRPNINLILVVKDGDGNILKTKIERPHYANPTYDDFIFLSENAYYGRIIDICKYFHYKLVPGKYTIIAYFMSDERDRLKGEMIKNNYNMFWSGKIESNQIQIVVRSGDTIPN